MNIVLLYGTETGNAEMLCDELAADLAAEYACTILDLGDADPLTLDMSKFHVFVTSTYGSGELPTEAEPFETTLLSRKPDLSGLRFAIFGLGDQAFGDTYNNGSKRLADALISSGATQVGERGLHNASSMEMPEDVALPWLQTIKSGIISQ